mgnify:CR=1 FL=1
MPTATPKVENRENGKIQKWSIQANDPELDEVFPVSYNDGEIALSSSVSTRSREFTGTWKVLSGTGSNRDIGETNVSLKAGYPRVLVFDGGFGNQLDEHIGRFFTQDEREDIAGDWSFDSDHANEILGSERIIFYREIEEPEPEPEPEPEEPTTPDEPTSPGVPEGEEPEDSQRPMLIYASAIILALVLSR